MTKTTGNQRKEHLTQAGTTTSRRSDDIRQRHTTRTGKKTAGSQTGLLKDYARLTYDPKKALAKRKARKTAEPTRVQPPVINRYNWTVAMPVQKDKRGKPVYQTRRRNDIRLDTPGGEMRLPSMPVVHVGWRLLSLLLAAALAFMIYQAFTLADFQVKEAKINGLKRISKAEVTNALGIFGQPIFLLDANNVSQNLRTAFPEFSAATIQITFPNSLAITVTERIPVLAWRIGNNINLLDKEGIAVPVRSESALAGLPIVEAAGFPDFPQPVSLPSEDESDSQPENSNETTDASPMKPLLSPDLVQAVLALTKQAPDQTRILYNREHGFGWKDPRGWDVYFGDIKDIDMKLRVYLAVVKKLNKQEITPQLISVEYVHAPYYRLEH